VMENSFHSLLLGRRGGSGFVQVRVECQHCPFNPCTVCDPLAVGVKQGGDVSSLWSLFDRKKKFLGDEVTFKCHNFWLTTLIVMNESFPCSL
jgi:hypothetical protein